MLHLAMAFTAALAAPAPGYSAQPVMMPEPRFAIRDTMWRCGAAGCNGDKSSSRPEIVCAAFVKKVGPVTAFLANGRAMGPEDLEKCNASAR